MIAPRRVSATTIAEKVTLTTVIIDPATADRRDRAPLRMSLWRRGERVCGVRFALPASIGALVRPTRPI